MSKGLRRSGLISIVVVLVLAVGGSFVWAATTTNNHVRGVVLFVGDSNIIKGAENIDLALTWGDHFDNGYVPVMEVRVGAGIRNYTCVNATGCTTTDYWRGQLSETLARVNPSAIVVNLGVNDTPVVGTSTTPGYTNYAQKIDWFMSLIPRSKPVIWTNLPCAIEPTNRLPGCPRINSALAAATARWPNLWVVDWAAAANTHPKYMASPGTDVHLSKTGEDAWIALVVSLLDAKFPPP